MTHKKKETGSNMISNQKREPLEEGSQAKQSRKILPEKKKRISLSMTQGPENWMAGDRRGYKRKPSMMSSERGSSSCLI